MKLPIFKSRYFWFVVSLAFLYKLIALWVYTYDPRHLSLFWSESNLGENMAAAAWGLGAALCLVKLFFFLGKGDHLILWLWSFFAFFLGVTRELDMHKKFDEIFGITWKSEFLNDPSVSIVLKIVLIAMMVTIALSMFGSILYKHRSLIREVNAGNVMITVFIMGMVYMAVGFLLDGSVLGNKFFFSFLTRSFAKLCEEVFETVAACLACLSVAPFFYKKNAFSNNQ